MLEQTTFRFTDPETSRQGAEHVAPKLGRLKAELYDSALQFDEPFTAYEVANRAADRFEGSVESYRKRVHELVRDNLLAESGVKNCSVTGQPAKAYLGVRG